MDTFFLQDLVNFFKRAIFDLGMDILTMAKHYSWDGIMMDIMVDYDEK